MDDEDAGSDEIDAGDGDAGGDAGKIDAGGGDVDAGMSDAGTPSPDAGMNDAGMSNPDAGMNDAGMASPDAGACSPPVCPAPPDGCAWTGGTMCSCGILECPAADCGGVDCRMRQYCEYTVGCSGAGTCMDRPTSCLAIFDPVCGCDGMTYSNSCVAASMGVDVAFMGECPTPPGDCRTEGCTGRETCEPCRGVGGVVYVCLPPGTVC